MCVYFQNNCRSHFKKFKKLHFYIKIDNFCAFSLTLKIGAPQITTYFVKENGKNLQIYSAVG
ncbi:hypothetical protein GCM10011325_20890 [Dyadobacter sediminis]|nr:hypothetical protein GCM10011325_20890 [Dyadobacter sediminis]